MLPLQRMHLNVFEPRYRSLVRTSLAGGRRFGMVGFNPVGGYHQNGVEVLMEDCVQTPDGRFQVQIVGTRAFRIVEAQQQPEGYIHATVSWIDPEGGCQEGDVAAAESLLPGLEEWQELVRKERPRHLESVLQELGPMPPLEQPGKMAMWVAALLNPLPPLGVAPELRAPVLAADSVAARLAVVKNGLEASLVHLRQMAKSPLRKCLLLLTSVPPPVTMVIVVALACMVSATSPADVQRTLNT
ncbi:unnamed protein product [Polarella glacialis]|uniref:Lon N-terminal domain-containing protein n=3 Tax=Polarella glacialis TaxID=89957 RepID=A0A813ESD8_POLGL|nr:unnamed protein product [Polarella glacialis]